MSDQNLNRRKFLSALAGAGAFASSLELEAAASTYNKTVKYLKKNKHFNTKKITVLYPSGSRANLLPVAKLFKEVSGVEVHLKEGSLDKISSEMAVSQSFYNKNTSFDVALPATFNLPDLAKNKIILDLTEYSKKYESPNFTESGFCPVKNTHLNSLYGYQTDGDAFLGFYNKKLINLKKDAYQQKFSKPHEAAKTWEQLDQQIKFFNNPKQGHFGGTLFRNKRYMPWEFWMRLHSKGYFPVSDTMKPQFNNPAGLAALSEMIETTKYLDPTVKKNSLFDNFKAFSKANSYFNLGWGGTQKYLRSEDSLIKNDILPAQPPGGIVKGQHFYMPYFNWGWSYVVSTKSKMPELAYLFCLFAATPEISTLAIAEQGGYFDPFRKEHFENKKIQSVYGEDFLTVQKEALNNSIPFFYIYGKDKYFNALRQSLYLADAGYLTPKKALDLAAAKWDVITEEFGRESQIKQWMRLKKLYPKKLALVLT